MIDIILDELNAVLAGADPNICNEEGESLLEQLLSHNYENIAKHIVQAMNSDQVNFVDSAGDSLFETACSYASEEIAELLIAKGAHYDNDMLLLGIGAEINEEFILRYFDFSVSTDDTDFFLFAYVNSYVELLKRFLQANYPVEPDILNYNFREEEKMEDICLQLLDLGVNPLTPNHSGVTCLNIAIDAGFSRFAMRLLDLDYDFKFIYDTRSLLEQALVKNMFDVAKRLILRGHRYDPEIEKLELPIPIQRMLSARYPEYQQRHSLRLNEVQYTNQQTRNQIIEFTRHNENRLPPEILEIIFNDMNI